MDFEVKAILTHKATIQVLNNPMLGPEYGSGDCEITVIDAESDWSNIQTVTVGESSIIPTVSPTQTPTPTLSPTDALTPEYTATATPSDNPMQPQTQQEAAFGMDWQLIVIAALVAVVAALAVVMVLQRKSGSRKMGTP